MSIYLFYHESEGSLIDIDKKYTKSEFEPIKSVEFKIRIRES